MGLGSFFKKAASKVGSSVRGAATLKNLSYLGPIAAPLALTSGGRAALKETYGGAFAGVVDSWTGGLGGSVVTQGLNRLSPDKSGGGGAGGGGGASAESYQAGGQTVPTWAYLAIAATVVVAAFIYFRKK